MKCKVCGSPLHQTRCGKNSHLICPLGHTQTDSAANLRERSLAQQAVEDQGIGE